MEISIPLSAAMSMICIGLFTDLTCACKFLSLSSSLQKSINELEGFLLEALEIQLKQIKYLMVAINNI